MNDFDKFSAVNKQRAVRWHRGGIDEWSVTDWSNAFAGEAGELCNAVKKYRRVEDEIQGHDGDTPQPKNTGDAIVAIAKEIGVRENLPERAPLATLDPTPLIRKAVEAIATDRDFVVHSNRVTEEAMRELVKLSGADLT